jgi:hypothetical protein
MEWSDEEKVRLMRAWCPGTHEAQACAVANCTLELVRVRGGTMTAHEAQHTLDWVRQHGLPGPARKFSDHMATQGTRIAMLEAELRECQRTRADASARAEEAERLAVNRQVECEPLHAALGNVRVAPDR